jgi:DNA ligase (NAD+)
MALGVPLTQASLKAMGNVTWQTLSGHNVKNWQSLPGTGERRRDKLLPSSTILALPGWHPG